MCRQAELSRDEPIHLQDHSLMMFLRLSPARRRLYACRIMLRSLWRDLRAKFRGRPSNITIDRTEEEISLDPLNPFPEPVVVEFSDVIDLHSIPPSMVRTVVEEYLEEARVRRVKWVRIIHGKGVGVQREIVRAILKRSPFVLEFKDAPPEAGGWGATLVTLAPGQESEG